VKTAVLLALCALATSAALGASWLDQPPEPDLLLSNRATIHQAVLALEQEPLHQNALLVREVLVIHFRKVDYLICGDVLGPLTESEAMEPVMWQIVIASGDWVEEHPGRAKDIDAYTLAGLESGVRTYKSLRAVQPETRHELMEELAVMYESGRLEQWNAEHPCRPQ
jgi:hypothetical protein